MPKSSRTAAVANNSTYTASKTKPTRTLNARNLRHITKIELFKLLESERRAHSEELSCAYAKVAELSEKLESSTEQNSAYQMSNVTLKKCFDTLCFTVERYATMFDVQSKIMSRGKNF